MEVEKISEVFARYESSPTHSAQLYLISCHTDTEEFVKVGYSENPRRRLTNMRTANPWGETLKLLAVFRCVKAPALEQELHQLLARFRKSGEWFTLPSDVLERLRIHMPNIEGTPDPSFVAPDLAAFNPPTATSLLRLRCEGKVVELRDHIRGRHTRSRVLGDGGKPHWYQLSNGLLLFCDNVWETEAIAEAQDAIEVPCPSPVQRVLVLCDGKLCTVADRCDRDKLVLVDYDQALARHLELLDRVCHWPTGSCHASVLAFRRSIVRHLSMEDRKKRQLCLCGQFVKAITYSQTDVGCTDCQQLKRVRMAYDAFQMARKRVKTMHEHVCFGTREVCRSEIVTRELDRVRPYQFVTFDDLQRSRIAQALQLCGVPDPRKFGARVDPEMLAHNADAILQLMQESAAAGKRRLRSCKEDPGARALVALRHELQHTCGMTLQWKRLGPKNDTRIFVYQPLENGRGSLGSKVATCWITALPAQKMSDSNI